MNASPVSTTQFVAECEALGVRFLVDGGRLTIDAPKTLLTSDLIDRVKARKPELLAMLVPDSPAKPTDQTPDGPERETTPPITTAVCRCGSTTWRDVPIHAGQSVRRDCAGCRKFLDFPVWYG